jgi:acyl carrier protein
MNAIPAELTALFQEVFENPALVVKPETTARDIESWDSLMHIQLVVAIERKFGIRFETGEIEQLQNVGDMAGLIAKKQN